MGRVLVTGGAGFLGRPLVGALLDAGRDVVVLDDLSTGDAERLDRRARLVVGDVADAAAVDRAVAAAGCDAVVHLAAARAVPRSVAEPLEVDRINTGGTLAVLEACRRAGVRRVVLASSSSVYGDAAVLPTPESAPLRPRSPYAVSKVAGEHYGRVAAEVHGLEVVALRYFNLYGPGASLDGPFPTLVPSLVGALLAGRRPVLHDGGRRRRDLTFVGDAVAATLAAATAPGDRVAGRAFNVGTGRSTSVAAVLASVQSLLGTSVPAVVEPARAGDVGATCADVRSAASALGVRAAVALEDGLASTVADLAGQAGRRTTVSNVRTFTGVKPTVPYIAGEPRNPVPAGEASLAG